MDNMKYDIPIHIYENLNVCSSLDSKIIYLNSKCSDNNIIVTNSIIV